MSNGAFIGSNNIAQKITNAYIGVEGTARRIKRAYIGVNGVARLFYFDKTDWAKYGVTFSWSKYSAESVNMYKWGKYNASISHSISSVYETRSIGGIGAWGGDVYYCSKAYAEANRDKWFSSDGSPNTTFWYSLQSIYVENSSSGYSYANGTLSGTYCFLNTGFMTAEYVVVYNPSFVYSSSSYYPYSYSDLKATFYTDSVSYSKGDYIEDVTSEYDTTYPKNGYQGGYYYTYIGSEQGYKKGAVEYGQVISRQHDTYPSNGTPDNVYWYILDGYEHDANPFAIVNDDDPNKYPSDGLLGDYYYIKSNL